MQTKVYVLTIGSSGQKSKRLHHLQKIINFYVSNGSIKIKIKQNDKGITITHTADFEKVLSRN